MSEQKVKAVHNKTIDMPLEQCQKYFERCISAEQLSPNRLTAMAKSEVGSGVKVDTISIIDKTINGDTLQVLPLLPTGCADLLIADPPYNLTKNYGGNVFSKTGAEQYSAFTESWLLPSLKLLKKNASIYICCDWESSVVIANVLVSCQNKGLLKIRNRITWQREKGRGAKTNWKNSMEDIWFATVANDYTFNLDDVKVRRKVVAPYKTEGKPKDWEETADGNFRNTCPSNFWDDISIPYWSMPENTAHPTQKSEKLIAKLILASSNKDDLVFDPFLGSGTTSVTAKKLARHYCGIEQNPQYCAWAEYRLEKADSNNTIQGYADGVFWERNTGREQNIAKKDKCDADS